MLNPVIREKYLRTESVTVGGQIILDNQLLRVVLVKGPAVSEHQLEMSPWTGPCALITCRRNCSVLKSNGDSNLEVCHC